MSKYARIAKGHVFTAQQESDRKRWARRFIARLEGIGHGLGYAIYHGGSLIRDIDICAVPMTTFQTTPEEPFEFIAALHHRLGIHLGEQWETLFGHRQAELWMDGHEDHVIDLKVIRPAPKWFSTAPKLTGVLVTEHDGSLWAEVDQSPDPIPPPSRRPSKEGEAK